MTEDETLKNIDEWVKEINKLVTEVSNESQHNYELIYELKNYIDDINNEIKVLKLLILLIIKEQRCLK